MDRDQFEHLIAAAANALGEDEFVVIGSQAILGPHPDAPEDLLRSMEADIYPKRSPDRAIEIDGSLGDGSPFHEAHGFYAHGVGPETARPPKGWENRLVVIDIPPRVASDRTPRAHCLESHDLVLAKCVANRDRDWAFAADAIAGQVVSLETLLSRVDDLPVSVEFRENLRVRLANLGV